ncbi:MAG: NAD-dependent epimerase/dehydratase family protein [Microthrixaceae bacterium]|nr:NAD-dependent epimerase/dehydratase family protein [Microthrixaceae bacterium]HPB44562.1 NAD-dependent epimerase/dehydratase family protein [Microthrixaceae bacterium]
MKVFITGSTGFVGSHVVAAALGAGHDVVALVRPASSDPFPTLSSHPRLTLHRGDLRDPRTIAGAFDGVDVVVHLAAAKAGDFATQFAGTVIATENLIDELARSRVRRLVAISTFSVYDFSAIEAGSLIDETSPIDGSPTDRDEYAQTKLIQERLYREEMAHREVVILRPGMIYGRDNLWHPLLGSELGPVFLRIGSRATMPMTYVENTAAAIVAAIDADGVGGETINIVDDDLPTQKDYARDVEAYVTPPSSVPVPWPVMSGIAHLLDRMNRSMLGGRAKFPGVLVPAKLDGRFKPFRYSNVKAKRLLAWTPTISQRDAFVRSLRDDVLTEVAGRT